WNDRDPRYDRSAPDRHHDDGNTHDLTAVSTIISSVHRQVDRLVEFLGNSSDASQQNASSMRTMAGQGYHQHQHRGHVVEVRKLQQLLSQNPEALECLCSGEFYNTDMEETPADLSQISNFSAEQYHQDVIQRQEELILFVDDLLSVVCLENNSTYEDPSVASLLNSIVIDIAGSILPNLTTSCIHPLNQEQHSRLLRRVFYQIQDVSDEHSYLNARVSSPEFMGDLQVLERLVTLLNEEVSTEQLEAIVDPAEAVPALQLPLELLSHTVSGGTQRDQHNALQQQPYASFPPSLTYSLRVLLNSLLQYLSQMLVREHEKKSCETDQPTPSIREWLLQQGSRTTGDNSMDRMPTPVEQPKVLVTREEEGSPITVPNAKELLVMLDQYGTSLSDVTMSLLQESSTSKSQDDQEYYDDSQRASDVETSLEKIEMQMRMVHLTAEFMFVMDSEQAIASNYIMTGALRSLWTEFATFVLDQMTNGIAYQDNDGLQAAATEILFRLTKTYIGVLFRSEAMPAGQRLTPVATPGLVDDEICSLITTIFCLMQGTNEESWNGEGKEWVAYLLEKHPSKSCLQQTLYAALLALTSCPEENQVQDEAGSNYFTLLGLTGLDDAAECHFDDPWKSYLKDVIFPSV
ncbi:MAG: hypothetical protein SGILL_003043, partial [Bacillariaceae sp.]